jgi:hypothetical protein
LRTKVNKDRARNPALAIDLSEVDISTLELLSAVALVDAVDANAVLGADGLPELATNLVTALSNLDGDDLAHLTLLPLDEKRKEITEPKQDGEGKDAAKSFGSNVSISLVVRRES